MSLGVGLGVVSIAPRDDNDSVIPTDDHASVAQLPLPTSERAVTDAETEKPRAAVITDAALAVTSFLDAEQRGDFDASYALLVAEDQELFPSAARWAEAHRDIPEITHFDSIEQVDGTDTRAAFRADLSLQPRLDETVGAVAARAAANFVAVNGDGGWHIAFSESSLTPEYPDADGARRAALTWANARQRCERSGEWSGGLLGVAAEAYAERLCDTTADVRAGEPMSLDRASGTEPVLAAFGPEASIWSRVVRISGPIDLDVVTAPLGEEWVVVGALQTSSGGSTEPA